MDETIVKPKKKRGRKPKPKPDIVVKNIKDEAGCTSLA